MDADDLMDQACALRSAGKLDKAIETCKEAIDVSGGDDETVRLGCEMLRERGSHAAVVEYLRPIVDRYPGRAVLLSELALSLWWIGQEDEAVVHYRRSVDADPSRIDTVSKFATLLMRREEFDEPVALFERAAKASGKAQEVYMLAAKALAHNFRFDPAERFLDLAKAEGPLGEADLRTSMEISHNAASVFIVAPGDEQIGAGKPDPFDLLLDLDRDDTSAKKDSI